MATTTNGSTSSSAATNDTNDLAASAKGIASDAKGIASDVADRAVAATKRLPDAASATGLQIEKANEIIRSESDEVLAVGTSLSLGMAIGLLLGGANRLLVILSLVPATAMGLTLFDRHNGKRPNRQS